MPVSKEINKEDLINLSQANSVEARIFTVEKVADYYKNGQLTDKGTKLAEDIFRIIVSDVETQVREALANTLKASKTIPADVADRIIGDEDMVSVGFIKDYAGLTADEMKKVVMSRSLAKQKAVAGRVALPADVSDYIVNVCPEEVVGVLVSNNSAKIEDKTYTSIINKYSASDNIKQRLIYREEIPVSAVEKVVSYLSEELKRQLLVRHVLPGDMVADLVEDIREKTTLSISEHYSSDSQIKELVEQLHNSDRLTYPLVLRAACMGDIRFLEYALSLLAKVPLEEVNKVLFHDREDFRVRNLLRKANIPSMMFTAIFYALKVSQEVNFDSASGDSGKSFASRVIERILSSEEAVKELSKEDLSYLIGKIGQ